MRRLLGVLAASGVLLAPIETMAHAQGSVPGVTAMAMAMAPAAAAPMGDQAPRPDGSHHCSMPCCDLCFGGCNCTAAAIAPIAVITDRAPIDEPVLRPSRSEPRDVAVRLVPHATPFALPPPGFASS